MPLVSSPLALAPCPVPLMRTGDVIHPDRAIARGELVRVRPGVYAPAALWIGLPPWDRYLARVHAVLTVAPDVVLSHESAVAALGGPVFGDPEIVHVLADARGASRLVGGVRTHTSADDRAILDVGGVALTSPADAAVDLARTRHPAVGLAVADAAIRRDHSITPESLAAINEGRASSRGRNIARWPLNRADGSAETSLESVSRAVIAWLGFPPARLQVTFTSASGEHDRCDFFWDDFSVAGEADGDLKYDGRFGDPRIVLRNQSRRDTRLREHARTVSHWGWTDATTVTPLRGILRGAGLRPTTLENSAALFSLRRSLASRPPHATAPASGRRDDI